MPGFVSVTDPEVSAASSPLNVTRALKIGVAFLLVQVTFPVLSAPFSRHAPQGTSPAVFEIPAMFLGGTAALFVAWRMTRRTFAASSDPEPMRAIGWSPSSARIIASSAVIGLFAAAAVVAAAARFPNDHVAPMATLMADAPAWCYVVAFVMVVVLAPPTEEFLFRGVLLHGLSVSWGRPLAAILVTAVFVSGHLPNVGNDWLGILVHTVIAVGLLVVRLNTGSLIPGVAMHAAYNCGVIIWGNFWAC